jgi:DNA-binding NtrC family response regulator
MQDIPLLARHFLRLFRQSMNHSVRDFSPDAVEKLAIYSWPGNIRELRNIVERTLVLHSHQDLILPGHLPEFIQTRPVSTSPARREGTDLESAISACERELILHALRECKGNQTRAARLLGTTRRILRYKMNKLSLSATS